MELTHLRQFKAVAETENVAAASKLLFISQPSLHRTIKKLEEELGCELFDRSRRRLKLNMQGKIVLSYATAMLGAVDELEESFSSRSLTPKKTLQIGTTSDSILNYLIPAYPDGDLAVSTKLCSKESYLLKSRLLEGNLDLIISGEMIMDKDVRNRYLFSDRIWVSVPLSDPLSKKRTLRLKDLHGKVLVATNSNSLFNWFIKNKVADSGIDMPIFWCSNLMGCYQMVEKFEYFYLTSSITTQHLELQNRKFIPLADVEGCLYPYYASYLKRKEKQISPFLSWVIAHYDNI